MLEKTPGDFDEIVKKFHNNFGNFFIYFYFFGIIIDLCKGGLHICDIW